MAQFFAELLRVVLWFGLVVLEALLLVSSLDKQKDELFDISNHLFEVQSAHDRNAAGTLFFIGVSTLYQATDEQFSDLESNLLHEN